jgi:predicted dehydrogenase/threonine dehydrogenase-like Zn-dependent dehydrogenase
MKTLIQDLSNGAMELIDAPDPAPQAHEVVVETLCSAISMGTESMLASFARANLLDKARQQPERVRQVIARARRDGLAQTAQTIQRRLAQPLIPGYAQVGVVRAVGREVEGVIIGQRVVSNGPHASMAAVPATLCAHLPDGVPLWQAAHAPICAVALHAIRLTNPTLGESFVVVGAGLLGFVAAQLLLAQGCEVCVIEPDPARLALVRALGVFATTPEAAEDAVAAWAPAGADGALICASSDDPELLRQTARLCRRRGRVVLVGVAPLTLDRADMYARELTFQVAAAYGPGRYAPGYEEHGLDYPLEHVRWTAQRNFDAVLAMMRRGALDLTPLAPAAVSPDEASGLYARLGAPGAPMAAVITWAPEVAAPPVVEPRTDAAPHVGRPSGPPTLGVIGAGTFATQTFLPALMACGARAAAICSPSGASAALAARQFKIPRLHASAQALLEDATLDAAVILTRHDAHAELVIAALAAGKHVLVEKPLCVTGEELDAIEAAWAARPRAHQFLMVGANRRFAPMTTRALELLAELPGPRRIRAIIHAGRLDEGHWTRRAAQGGRLLGEGIHWLDWSHAIAGAALSEPLRVVRRAGWSEVHARFEGGHTATIEYVASSPAGLPKERLEIEAAGRMIEIVDWRALKAHGWRGRDMAHLIAQRGHAQLIAAFMATAAGAPAPITVAQTFGIARAALAMREGG